MNQSNTFGEFHLIAVGRFAEFRNSEYKLLNIPIEKFLGDYQENKLIDYLRCAGLDINLYNTEEFYNYLTEILIDEYGEKLQQKINSFFYEYNLVVSSMPDIRTFHLNSTIRNIINSLPKANQNSLNTNS